MDSVRSQLEILSEDSQGKVNYESWKFKLDITLKFKGLANIAYGTTVRPEGNETSNAVAAWIKSDLEAQTLIGLNCSSSVAKKLCKCTSAQAMLQKLDVLYGKKSDVCIATLQRRFINYKYDEEKSVVENCYQIQELADALAAEGETLKEGWIMNKIMDMLPKRLHHFRTVWDNIVSTDKTMSNLFERLRLEDDRQSVCEEGNKIPRQTALLSKQSNKSGLENSKKNGKDSCYKCGKKGHLKADCKNKPCEKYIQYCKDKFGCKICKAKGHFAKECKNKDVYKEENKDNQDESKDSKRRAFVTVGLSAADTNCSDFKNKIDLSWFQDCAATQHMTSHEEWMSNYSKFDEPTMVILGDGTEIPGIGAGDVKIEAFDGEMWQKTTLKNVLHTPTMPFNLFSVVMILDKGYEHTENAQRSTFKDSTTGETVAIAEREGKLFKMKFRQDTSEVCMLTLSLRQWHEKLAHQNVKHVKEILNDKKIKYIDDWNGYVCPGCVFGKQHRVSHPIDNKVASNPLDLIHVDLCEMNIRSLGGAKYFLLFKDDYTHYRTVYFLAHKSEVASKLDIFMKLIQNQFEKQVKFLKSDQGKEIKNSTTQTILEELGVFHSKSSTYTPQQNGRIEREMRTVVEAARSVIHAKGLNENLWAEAVNYAVFTLNQSGTSSCKGSIPAEMWFGRKMKIENLKIFGCKCYVFIQDRFRGKTEKKSKSGIFVGYDIDAASFRVQLDDDKQIVSSNDVIFDETPDNGESFSQLEQNLDQRIHNYEEAESSDSRDSDYTDESENESVNLDDVFEPEGEQPVGRILRDRQTLKKPARYDSREYDLSTGRRKTAMVGAIHDVKISTALKDAKWKSAIHEEYDSLTRMRTWDLVKLPSGARSLTNRWVLSQKENGKHKARLVVRGYEQKEGVDFSETFSPVARHHSIRLILSIAASKDMKLMTFDVKTAFLHGDLQETLFMFQPEGFNDGSGRVCRLNKSIYGLKQSPKNWGLKFSSYLKSIGFVDTDDDPCVYYNKNMIIALHVDDGLIAGESRAEILDILKKLNEEFEITYDTAPDNCLSYLGMKIEKLENEIVVTQPNYTKKILERFNSNLSNPTAIPMEKGMYTNQENFCNDKKLDKAVPFREAIGSLLYLSTISRPDISFAVNYLSRFNNKPMKSHWTMVKRIFSYLQGTINFGISFNGDSKLVAYSDSDYAGDPTTRHSTSGVLLMRGGPIVWFTQKQHMLANSTSDAEYRAAVSCIDEVCWIRRLGIELGVVDAKKPTPLLVDNKSAINMLKNAHEGKITKGKKHIEIARKFVQQHIGTTVELKHVPSSEQLADILTKPLPRDNFENLRIKIIKEEC